MISLLLAAALVSAGPVLQEPGSRALGRRVTVRTGAVEKGQLRFDRLGLGDGGVPAVHLGSDVVDPGQFETRGRVLIRAQIEGVKLDFPSGGELLVDSRARVHVRDGSATRPHAGGVRLWLTDGALVDVHTQAGGPPHPLRLVEVHDADTSQVLWRSGKPLTRQARLRGFHGPTFVALGDGRVLYATAQVGPVVVLERVLCPRDLQDEHPELQIVIVGEVLARSLLELPRRVPQKAVTEPRVKARAYFLASMAQELFPPESVASQPAGAADRMLIPLAHGFHLRVAVRSRGVLALGLVPQGRAVPLAEWTVTGGGSRLHLIDYDEERGGRPRYLMQGFELRHLVDPLLPGRPSSADRSRALRVLTEAGARDEGQTIPLHR